MIVIVDYGMGNLNSVKRKLSRIGQQALISSSPKDIESAEKLILPGVGHFSMAMENLRTKRLLDPLNEAVKARKVPILGICLGMQLMARHSEEGDTQGLGWFDAEVIRFRINDSLRFKVPHTGWNQVVKSKSSDLMRNIPDLSAFYFVHAYHMRCNDRSDILNETDYEYNFVSAVQKDNIFGVQYHPEKSHDIGEVLFRNFLGI